MVDAACNPHAIRWPWGGGAYARSIALRVVDLQEGESAPLAVRSFSG